MRRPVSAKHRAVGLATAAAQREYAAAAFPDAAERYLVHWLVVLATSPALIRHPHHADAGLLFWRGAAWPRYRTHFPEGVFAGDNAHDPGLPLPTPRHTGGHLLVRDPNCYVVAGENTELCLAVLGIDLGALDGVTHRWQLVAQRDDAHAPLGQRVVGAVALVRRTLADALAPLTLDLTPDTRDSLFVYAGWSDAASS